MALFFTVSNLRNPLSHNTSTTVIALDETSVLWDAVSNYFVEKLGAKNVTVRVRNEKICSTALLSVRCQVHISETKDDKGNIVKTVTFSNAVHHRPLVIFSGTETATGKNSVNRKAEALEEQHNVATAVTTSGWMTAAVFIRWIGKYVPQLNIEKGERGWLLLDLFAAHRTPEVIKAIKLKGFIPFFIPGGCTSKLQFHDVMVNRS